MLPLLLLVSFCCNTGNTTSREHPTTVRNPVKNLPKNKHRVIHVFVALCDNKYQGIVPVPAAIGNGQHPGSNLYWGASLGIKSFFKRQPEWKLVKTEQPIGGFVLERIVFKNATENCWLVADAYNGKEIKDCTTRFLKAASGQEPDSVSLNNEQVYCGGSAELVAYIGHNGLMDFSINETFSAAGNNERSAVILACISKRYFAPLLKPTGAKPLLWTTGLMCPEAYSLHAAINSWFKKENAEATSARAAAAYHKYQHCGVNAAKKLLVSGW